MLEYLFVYLKDDGSVLIRGRNRVVGAGSCAVQCVSLGAGSDAVTDRCSELCPCAVPAGNQTRG